MSATRIKNVILPMLLEQSRNNTYLDIGANVGNTTLPCINFFKKLHSFEPNPNAILQFKENVLSNNVTLHELAISNFQGTATLTEPNNNSEFSTISERRLKRWEGRRNNKYKRYDVDVRSIDSFNFENVDFIKIDTEQSENEVIEGCLETIKRCSPIIFMENKRKEAAIAKDMIIKLGYNFSTHKADVLFTKRS